MAPYVPRLKRNLKHEEQLTVDAGLTGTGLAFWRNEDWTKPVEPVKVLNIHAPDGEDWQTRSEIITERFLEVLRVRIANGKQIVKVSIEYPEYFDSTARTQASAKRGDVAKLIFVVGRYAEACRYMRIPVDLIEVSTWIGQVGKEVIKDRIRARLPEFEKNHKPASHMWDATGLGLFLKGHLNQDLRRRR